MHICPYSHKKTLTDFSAKVLFFYAVKDASLCPKQDKAACLATTRHSHSRFDTSEYVIHVAHALHSKRFHKGFVTVEFDYQTFCTQNALTEYSQC